MRMYLIAYYTGKMILGVGPFYNTEDMEKMQQSDVNAFVSLGSTACNLAAIGVEIQFKKVYVNDPNFRSKYLEIKCVEMEGIPEIVNDKLYTVDQFTGN